MLRREGQREMSRKINVLEASLKKVEAVCYNINVRSTEIPKHLVMFFPSFYFYIFLPMHIEYPKTGFVQKNGHSEIQILDIFASLDC